MRFKITEPPKTWEELNVQSDWWWVHRLTLDNSTWLFLPNTLANKPKQVIRILDSTWQELDSTKIDREYPQEELVGLKVILPEQDDDEILIVETTTREPILDVAEDTQVVKTPETKNTWTTKSVEKVKPRKKRKRADLKPLEWMDVDSMTAELYKKTRALKAAINGKDTQEHIDKLRKYVQNLAQAILSIKSSRHTAIWRDVEYLDKIELDYLMKWYVQDLQLAQDIIITPEYIKVAWLEVRRYDEQVPFVKDAGIVKTKDGKHTLFKIGAAKKHAASIWCSILTIEQLKQIISAMPWRTREEKEINFINIFNISFAGFFNNHEIIIHWFWEYGAYWMNPPKANKRLCITKIDKDKVHPSSYTRRYDAYALRCVRKTKKPS